MLALNRRHRYELFQGQEQLLDEVPRSGWAHFRFAKSKGFGGRHRHRSSYEIRYVESGQLLTLVDEQEVETNAGEVLILFPGQNHSGAGPNSAVAHCECYWLELPLAQVRHHRTGVIDTAGLARKFAEIDRQVFPVSVESSRFFRQIIE